MWDQMLEITRSLIKVDKYIFSSFIRIQQLGLD